MEKDKKHSFFQKKIWKNECFFLSPSVTGSQGEMSGDISPAGRKASCFGRIAAVLLLSFLFSGSKTLGCRMFLSQNIHLKQGLP
jgi:hypothetical protein